MNSTLAGRLPWCELAWRIEGLEGRVTMRATVVFGTRADTISPWLQSNENGGIFQAGRMPGMLRTRPSIRSLENEDRAMVAGVDGAADDRSLIAIVAGKDQPLGVPRIADIDHRIELTDEAWTA